MPNFKSISFKMAVLWEGGVQNLPSLCVCVIQKTPCGIELNLNFNFWILFQCFRDLNFLDCEKDAFISYQEENRL